MPAVITSEPRVYGPGSDASYFQDIALAAMQAPPSEEARKRLTRYATELDREIADPNSPEGRRALQLKRENRRSSDRVEQRAGASSTSIAGFTTPVYLVDEWAAYRSPARSFTDQTTKLPLPPFGLQVNVPSFTGASLVGTQTELSGVSDLSPTGSNISTSLVTQAGQVAISQQLFDRGGLSGMAFDKIILKQISLQLDAAVDTYVLTQALATAATVSDSNGITMAYFYQDLALAREKLSDTAGTCLLATHLFTTSDFFGYITRQVDSQLRPILPPDSGAIVAASQIDDPQWASWTGVHLGQMRWHTDDNIPASGSNTQLLVARPEEVYVFDGEQLSFAYPETVAGSLSVIVGLRSYVGVIIRYPKAIAAISGSTYPTTLV